VERVNEQEHEAKNPLLTVTEITLRFGGVTALDTVSFDVFDGELFAVIGPNGAGKTSIFNCLNAVYRPQAGHITFDGHRVMGARPGDTARWGIGRTFQNLGLFLNLDVIDNLMLGRHLHMRSGFLAGMAWWGRARNEELANRKRVEEIIELLELQPFRREAAGLLPFGIQKRIELGRALAMEPKLLLLDEPVAGMNSEETDRMAEAILEIRSALGISVVLVEHDMGMVMSLADRVTVLDFGRRIADGTPAEVQRDPEVIKAYLGSGDEIDPAAAAAHSSDTPGTHS
jgi:branched-chain amino acid transport system ATP-binding protein